MEKIRVSLADDAGPANGTPNGNATFEDRDTTIVPPAVSDEVAVDAGPIQVEQLIGDAEIPPLPAPIEPTPATLEPVAAGAEPVGLSVPVAGLMMRLFHARTSAHVLHLQTKSFAAHKALEEFYLQIVELADEFAETYQGKFGIIYNYPTEFVLQLEAVPMLDSLEEFINATRPSVNGSELQNILDELVALIHRTRYKLQNLS